MSRLYYVADDLDTTVAISNLLHQQGITDWNFHVLSEDEGGLMRRHVHSATIYQQVDILHTGMRWALVCSLLGLAIGLGLLYAAQVGWIELQVGYLGVALLAVVGGLWGGWQGGMIGLTRESYKIDRFHDDIRAGRYLIMVDAGKEHRSQIRELMNMRFPEVRFGGTDSAFINPFARPAKSYPQTTH